MKFGRQLEEAIYPEWQLYYISYNSLKADLRIASNDGAFTDQNETNFVEKLDKDLEKVNAFHQVQLTNIQNRIDTCSQAIDSLIPGEDSAQEMTQLQEEINEIADDINRLAKFSKINYTAVIKLVKKHDRHTPYFLRPLFMVRIKQCPFWQQNYDIFLLRLSELFNKVRSGSATMSFKPSSYMGNAMPVPSLTSGTSTTVLRYFVHKDDILELKTHILRHLPVLVYNNSTTKGEDIDPPISSLYLDTSSFDAYTARVEGAPGSQLFRLRWYGSVEGNAEIAFERRTLQEDTVTEKNDRFIIKDKYVDGFIKGDDTFITKTAKKIRSNPGKTEEDAIKFEELAREVQSSILEKKLAPVLRAYYRRTAFQVPGDRSVRISLDTDICFLREDSQMWPNDQKIRRPDGQWHRPDADINYPFDNLAEDQEISRFPYAQLEIKIEQASADSRLPRWVHQLTKSEFLEEAHNFTKFVHGVSMMFDQRVALLPFWLAHVDTDVNRLPLLTSQASSSSRALESPRGGKGKQKDVQANYERGISIDDENTPLISGGSSGSTYYVEEPSAPISHVISWSKSFVESVGGLFKSDDDDNNVAKIAARKPVILPPGVKIPAKIETALRVEPKVYFANERTYFAWMSFATLLGSFSIALFNAGDSVGRISGVLYTLVSLSTFLYGMGLYYRRRELINSRAAGPYDDMAGPTAICMALLFAVGMNAYLKFNGVGPKFF